MATTTRNAVPSAWRSATAIPVRPAEPEEPELGTRTHRIPLAHPRPATDDRRFPAKAFSGEAVAFTVTAFREGHDLIGVHVRLYSPSGDESLHRLTARLDGFDRWSTDVVLLEEGAWRFRFEAFADEGATWRRAADLKIAAGVDAALMRESGARLLERAAGDRGRSQTERRMLRDAVARLRHPDATDAEALEIVRDPVIGLALEQRPLRSVVTTGRKLDLVVERERAGVGAWYELFPRSEGASLRKDGTVKSGTFRTAARRLPGVAGMGFDVVYLPPIHPIGRTNRKGRNNTLEAGPADPGSPWAIGAAEGGHDAVHPDLGTLADFRAFVRAARAEGLEVALDLALQASPDHPWVREHPEWFTTLPDGSIAYAENPPKKYQDIYPLNFDNDPEGIRAEVLRIVRHWIAQGVRIFRVDNPHTKPLAFWERLMADFRERHPEVVFLAEAFTRPAMLRSLAGAGFQQSYTYFTWRNTKEELQEFLASISHETSAYLRPNLFVNTPDILSEYLQRGGRAGYQVRAAIAATGSPTWGVYAGYELVEDTARPGAEENADNEKYEYKARDWAGALRSGASLAPFIARLNEIRAEHPALRQLRNFETHWSDSEDVLVYSKSLPGAFTGTGSPDTVIVVANLDAHAVREANVYLDLERLGLRADAGFDVVELLSGARWRWGRQNWVRLDPRELPVHVLAIDPATVTP